MRTRFFHLFAVLVLGLWVPAASARNKSVDPALLDKANAGNAEAQYQLGSLYYRGDGVRRDYAQAAFWFRKSAEQGNSDSEFRLGGLYHFGQGVPQDSVQAFNWAMKAAKQGHTDAEFFVSTCYDQGLGVAKDNAQSVVWLRKGAMQGHFNSQYFLGWAYEGNAVSLPTDYAEAYFWLDLAASGQVTGKQRQEALKRRDIAASHLTAVELSRVQEQERKFRIWQTLESASD